MATDEQQGWTLREWQGKDGLKLRARDWTATREQQTVLCLAGLSRNSRDFDRLAAFLNAHGLRVIAMDYRGRGRSDHDPQQDYELASESEDIRLGLDALGIDNFSIVGTSRGGIHAMVLAATLAERVEGVVLNDIGPKVEYQGLARIAGIVGRNMQEPSWEAAAARLKQAYESSFTSMSDDDWRAFASQLYREADDGVRLDYDPALAVALEDLTPDTVPDLWPLFNSLPEIPLLMIQGENSDILTRRTVEEARRARPGMKTLTVTGEGHAPLLWDTATQHEILSFLKQRA
ncbi:alpha/beta fold hydrolase [Stappia sp. GBMRC 2046]|uniref:Alpha/beta fold hydrolase n=1 Tax=Stappia sediminis TaxID=2692190 RepID=A0A7X3LY65_9HYPH|nr:alpha/beta hydrolase [Stappia sediminis]MXN67265.1 alpha/beta fold hydrolase [Stappia sediminis]